MKNKLVLIVGGCVLLSIAAYIFYPSGEHSQTESTTGKEAAQDKPGSDNSGPEKEGKSDPESTPLPYTDQTIPAKPSVKNQKQAAEVIAGQKTKIGLGEKDELVINNNTSDKQGNAYYQIQQKYKGIPVYGAKAVLEIEHNQAVVLSGHFVKEIDVDTTPTHDAHEALVRALKKIGMAEDLEVKIEGEAQLIVFISTVGQHLAWLATVDFLKPAAPQEIMIIDAHDPAVLTRMPAVIQ